PEPQPEPQPEPVEPVEPIVQPESVESCAATPEQKSAKPRTTVQHTLTVAALKYLRNKHPEKYSKGFAEARPAIAESQMKPSWAGICKDAGVEPDEHPLPSRDMISRAMKSYRV